MCEGAYAGSSASGDHLCVALPDVIQGRSKAVQALQHSHERGAVVDCDEGGARLYHDFFIAGQVLDNGEEVGQEVFTASIFGPIRMVVYFVKKNCTLFYKK